MARVGFWRSFARLTAAVCTDLARVEAAAGEVHPAAVRCDCCTPSTKCGCTLHPPPSAPTPQLLLCIARLGEGVASGVHDRISGFWALSNLSPSYILSTYFALKFGLGWAAALCSSEGRRGGPAVPELCGPDEFLRGVSVRPPPLGLPQLPCDSF